MAWVFTLSVEIVTRAVAFVSCWGVPIRTFPFMNDTVPVGTPDCELTAAVNVTGFPAGEGFRLEVSCTVVVALRTVTDSGAELLAALDWSPL